MKVYTHKKYSYVRIAEISKDEIKKIDFDVCKQPTETLGSYYNRQTQKPDLIVNAGFFNMQNGEPCFNYISDGKVVNEYVYFKWGIGVVGGTDISFGEMSEKAWTGWISGYPNLLFDGKKLDTTLVNVLNYKARRTMLGFNDTTIYFVCVENPGMKFDEMQNLMLDIGCKYAINLDGGGSTKMLHKGKSVTKNATNRAVDNVIAVYLNGNTQTAPKKIDVIYQAYAKNKWWDKVENYNTINSNGYAGVERSPIQGIKMSLSEGSIQYRVHTTSGKWLPWVTDDSDYAGIIGTNTSPINCCFKGRFRVTSPRGYRGSEFHKGIDLVGTDDTTVYSICDGVVRTAYEANGAGNYVVVTMPDGRRVFYMHLAKFLVKDGAQIKKGAPLGIMGNTGRSTGAHTHLELRPAGTTSDSLDICQFTGITNKVGLYGVSSGQNIDGIQVKLIGDIANTHVVKYRVSATDNANYLPWVEGTKDYAGIFGKPIDKIQISVEGK
jgi:murein DD-endopeptidase MepM/ murein hydrolase activator NlpD